MRAFHVNVNVKDVPLSELMYDVKDGRLDITLVPKTGSWTPQDVAFKHGEDRYDLVIALDAPDQASLGSIAREQADFLYRTTIINVDCSPTNEHWGQLNLVDLNAVATCEVLHDWIVGWNAHLIDEPLATALLAGMIARTKSFRTPNVTPKTLAASSRLVELGAKRADIVQGLWRTRSVETLKLWGRALSRLEQDRQAQLVWTTLSDVDFLETGATPEALEGVVDELIAYAPEAKAVALISQQKGGTVMSLYIQPPFSAAELARPFGGNGTRERAVFTIEQSTSFAETVRMAISRLQATLTAIR
jgi:phosphoesterase RecJ-like protein